MLLRKDASVNAIPTNISFSFDNFAQLQNNSCFTKVTQMKIKSFLIITIVLITVWILLNNSLDPTLIIIGVGVSILIALIICSRC